MFLLCTDLEMKMAQKNVDQNIENIKDLLASGKLILGTERALKDLKNGKIAKLFLAKNTPAKVVEDVDYYSKLSGSEVVKLDITNEELGIVCRKPFMISIVSISK